MKFEKIRKKVNPKTLKLNSKKFHIADWCNIQSVFLRVMVLSYIALLDKMAKSMRKENTPMSNCKGITLTKQKIIVGKATTVVNLGVGILSSNSELAY